MRIRNLATFVKVARLGSFRAAAIQLHASQPAISARINALEDELGVRLFNRDKSGTHLTEKGSQMLPYAEKLLALSQEMKQQVGHADSHRGSLRIGIADTLAHLWLSPLLSEWQRQYPHISFELTSDVTPVLIEQLQQDQIDLTLMVSVATDSREIISEPLCRYPQVWVATPAVAAQHACWRIAELMERPVLSFPRDTAPWHYLQHLFNADDSELLLHTCSSVASLISLAERGLGLALLPQPLVEQSLEVGRLCVLQTEFEPPALSFSACWRIDEERLLLKQLAESTREVVNV
ncbi:MAG: LysR family transcriptional regulator [Pseudomonadales bacterium]